tara:strand:- start:2021 stop:2440 length:420 start_codon:yes stop_codon:yes gene_type:complete
MVSKDGHHTGMANTLEYLLKMSTGTFTGPLNKVRGAKGDLNRMGNEGGRSVSKLEQERVREESVTAITCSPSTSPVCRHSTVGGDGLGSWRSSTPASSPATTLSPRFFTANCLASLPLIPVNYRPLVPFLQSGLLNPLV